MDNTIEENNAQNHPADEPCCDTATAPPVTREELHAALNHVLDLIGRYDGRIAVACFLEDEKNNCVDQIFKYSETGLSYNNDNKCFVWASACGYFLKAAESFKNNHKTIGKGVRFFVEQQEVEHMRRG